MNYGDGSYYPDDGLGGLGDDGLGGLGAQQYHAPPPPMYGDDALAGLFMPQEEEPVPEPEVQQEAHKDDDEQLREVLDEFWVTEPAQTTSQHDSQMPSRSQRVDSYEDEDDEATEDEPDEVEQSGGAAQPVEEPQQPEDPAAAEAQRQNAWYKQCFDAMTEAQRNRLEAYIRSNLQKKTMKKVLQELTGTTLNDRIIIAISSITKMFVGELIETGMQQSRVPATAAPGALIAIADLHGDLGKAKEALMLLKVIGSGGNWVAKNVTVVQLGDLVDRGPSSLELLSYMHRLQDQALQHGSRLVLLLGNHELMNLQGDFSTGITGATPMPLSAVAAAAAALKTSSLHSQEGQAHRTLQPALDQLAEGGVDDIGGNGSEGVLRAEVAKRHQLLAVEGHGGCASAFIHAEQPDGADQGMLSCDKHRTCFGVNVSRSSSSTGGRSGFGSIGTGDRLAVQSLWSVLASSKGPVWSRHQAHTSERVVCTHLQQGAALGDAQANIELVLSRLGVQRLVVGHTVQESGRATIRGDGCAGNVNNNQRCSKLLQWNIERGYKLDLIIQQLKQADADILSLQEVDIGCERSGYRDTGKEIAQALGLNYIFVCEFQELHSPLRDASSQGGGVHGNAILTKYDLIKWDVIEHSHHPIDWNLDPALQPHPLAAREPRKGRRLSLAADIATPQGPLRVYCCHLEVFCGILSRVWQFSDILADAKRCQQQQQSQEVPDLPSQHASLLREAVNKHPHQEQEPSQPTVCCQAILGDLNTMGHSVARLSPSYCRDVLRWKTLGSTEAAWWQRNVLSVTAQVAEAAVNPGFFDPYDVDADVTLDNPGSLMMCHNLADNFFWHAHGKLDWALLRGMKVLSAVMGNDDYAASDHRWLLVEVALTSSNGAPTSTAAAGQPDMGFKAAGEQQLAKADADQLERDRSEPDGTSTPEAKEAAAAKAVAAIAVCLLQVPLLGKHLQEDIRKAPGTLVPLAGGSGGVRSMGAADAAAAGRGITSSSGANSKSDCDGESHNSNGIRGTGLGVAGGPHSCLPEDEDDLLGITPSSSGSTRSNPSTNVPAPSSAVATCEVSVTAQGTASHFHYQQQHGLVQPPPPPPKGNRRSSDAAGADGSDAAGPVSRMHRSSSSSGCATGGGGQVSSLDINKHPGRGGQMTAQAYAGMNTAGLQGRMAGTGASGAVPMWCHFPAGVVPPHPASPGPVLSMPGGSSGPTGSGIVQRPVAVQASLTAVASVGMRQQQGPGGPQTSPVAMSVGGSVGAGLESPQMLALHAHQQSYGSLPLQQQLVKLPPSKRLEIVDPRRKPSCSELGEAAEAK
eukprot:gene4582-4836_t